MIYNTRTAYTEEPVQLAIRLCGAADQCTMPQVPYPYHDIENNGTYNWKHTWNHTVSNHPIHQHGHTNFWYVCLLERVWYLSNGIYIYYSVEPLFKGHPGWWLFKRGGLSWGVHMYIYIYINWTQWWNKKNHPHDTVVAIIYKIQ